MFTYTIDKIAEDCYDVFVSEDDGYTWEFYYTYETLVQAQDDIECWLMSKGVTND